MFLDNLRKVTVPSCSGPCIATDYLRAFLHNTPSPWSVNVGDRRISTALDNLKYWAVAFMSQNAIRMTPQQRAGLGRVTII